MPRKWKAAPKGTIYRVSKINYGSGKFYISFWSSQNKETYENYWGSGKSDELPVGRELLLETTSKATAKYFELKTTIDNIDNPLMNNQMLNVRILKKQIKFNELKKDK